ncbi:MAG: hypothetical protein HUU54_14280 [Ignavibacteriaceae bacterium]|nr:hypothetical protein [Ignavibacteriaceae bacterium]
MNIFNVHNQFIGKYSKYISSFLDIADPRIRLAVEEYFNSHKLWPQPLLQFNTTEERKYFRSFDEGKVIGRLCKHLKPEQEQWLFDFSYLPWHQDFK